VFFLQGKKTGGVSQAAAAAHGDDAIASRCRHAVNVNGPLKRVRIISPFCMAHDLNVEVPGGTTCTRVPRLPPCALLPGKGS
jgi:hypothetical protein